MVLPSESWRISCLSKSGCRGSFPVRLSSSTSHSFPPTASDVAPTFWSQSPNQHRFMTWHSSRLKVRRYSDWYRLEQAVIRGHAAGPCPTRECHRIVTRHLPRYTLTFLSASHSYRIFFPFVVFSEGCVGRLVRRGFPLRPPQRDASPQLPC